jgi:hypothetical protein
MREYLRAYLLKYAIPYYRFKYSEARDTTSNTQERAGLNAKYRFHKTQPYLLTSSSLCHRRIEEDEAILAIAPAS